MGLKENLYTHSPLNCPCGPRSLLPGLSLSFESAVANEHSPVTSQKYIMPPFAFHFDHLYHQVSSAVTGVTGYMSRPLMTALLLLLVMS